MLANEWLVRFVVQIADHAKILSIVLRQQHVAPSRAGRQQAGVRSDDRNVISIKRIA
jgi:hypothetical protein